MRIFEDQINALVAQAEEIRDEADAAPRESLAVLGQMALAVSLYEVGGAIVSELRKIRVGR